MSTTFLSGCATCAPIAAGKPKPIVPAPPDVMIVFGLEKVMNWDVHIWCCPTSVTTMALPFTILSISWITFCGNKEVPSWGRTRIGYSSRHSRIRSNQLSWVCGVNSWFISFNTCFKSPTIGTSMSLFLPISAGSISTWMMVASLQNSFGTPAIRSSKRMPKASTTSASLTA